MTDIEGWERETMTLPEHENLLLIAAREPVAGETKTRLGATIGMDCAARLYRAFLADLTDRFAGESDFQFGWALTPDRERFQTAIASLGTVQALREPLFVPQVG